MTLCMQALQSAEEIAKSFPLSEDSTLPMDIHQVEDGV